MKSLLSIIRENLNHHRDELINKVVNSPVGTELPESDIYQYCEYLQQYHEDWEEGNIDERIEKYSKFKLIDLPLDLVDLHRFHIDDEKVEDFKQKFSEQKTYPPIIVDKKSGGLNKGLFEIIDGNHRANALHHLGEKTIKAWVGVK